MKHTLTYRLTAALLLMLSLSACGGGGGSTEPPADTAVQWGDSNWDQANWQ